MTAFEAFGASWCVGFKPLVNITEAHVLSDLGMGRLPRLTEIRQQLSDLMEKKRKVGPGAVEINRSTLRFIDDSERYHLLAAYVKDIRWCLSAFPLRIIED